MTLGISAIAHCHGSERIDNMEESGKYGFDTAFVRDKLGIAVRYRAGPQQATSDLAAESARLVLERTGTAAGDIGALVVVTQTPDYQLPHTAALVQSRLGLPDTCLSFDMGLGCSGWVYGAAVMSRLACHLKGRSALLVTADCYSKVIDPADRATAPLFSDAAAATLLSDDGAYGVAGTAFGTDGRGAQALIVPDGGSRNGAGPRRLSMDGRAIFNFMMTRVPQQVSACLQENRLSLDDIDRFVFHQANRYMLDMLRERMKIPVEKMVIDVEDGGNTVGSTVPIALERVLAQGHRRILACGFGVGLSWATVVLERRDAPDARPFNSFRASRGEP